MNRRRLAPLAVALVVTSAACGAGSDSAEPNDTNGAPATEDAPPAGSGSDEFTESDESENATVESVADEPVADGEATSVGPEPGVTEAEQSVAENATGEAEPTIEQAPSGPTPAELGGRTFAESIDPESQFDANPFPDLVVDDVGRETRANLANILPSDRPVLLWTWAPH